jgi:hypothetical protein
MNNRNRLWGLVGIVWGSVVVLAGLIEFINGTASQWGGTYRVGRFTGLAWGALLLGAGVYYFRKSTSQEEE